MYVIGIMPVVVAGRYGPAILVKGGSGRGDTGDSEIG